MIHVSKFFKERLDEDIASFHEIIDVTLTDGTEFQWTEADIWENGLSFEDSICPDNDFTIGGAIINKLTVTINNIYEQHSSLDFYGARLVCKIGVDVQRKVPVPIMLETGSYISTTGSTDGNLIYTDWNGDIEWIDKGTYYVGEQTFDGELITLTAYDSMILFDRDYSESRLSWGHKNSLYTILKDACDVCGVPFHEQILGRLDYFLDYEIPTQNRTFRQVIGQIAQMTGTYARINRFGELALVRIRKYIMDGLWDGTQTNTDYYHDLSGFYTTNIDVDDVLITGLKIIETKTTDEGQQTEEYFSGEDGYVLTIQGNDLIHDGTGAHLIWYIAQDYVGLKFRPFDVETNCNPTIEAGDFVKLKDHKGRIYFSVVTSTTFTPGSGQRVSCGAESAARNEAARYTQATVTSGNFESQINQITSALKVTPYIPALMDSVAITDLEDPFAVLDDLHDATPSHSVYFSEMSTYSITSDPSSALSPFAPLKAYWLEGWKYDVLNGKQIIRSYETNTAYARNCVNGAWGSWGAI